MFTKERVMRRKNRKGPNREVWGSADWDETGVCVDTVLNEETCPAPWKLIAFLIVIAALGSLILSILL